MHICLFVAVNSDKPNHCRVTLDFMVKEGFYNIDSPLTVFIPPCFLLQPPQHFSCPCLYIKKKTDSRFSNPSVIHP